MELKLLDVITLDDSKRYMVNGIAEYNGKEFVYLVDINTPSNVKICEELFSNNIISLSEVTDVVLINKLLPLLAKSGLEFIKTEKN